MFSIINTGLAGVLVWFSPGSQAKTTLAPCSARPVRDPGALPGPSLVSPRPLFPGALAATSPATIGCSHTPARPSSRESSHTREFTIA
jgi:hypothetical protein